MKSSVLWSLMILIVLVVGATFLISADKSPTSKVVSVQESENSDGVQIVKMYVKGSSYVFEPSTVKVGVPVRLVADMSRMYGCARSVISKDLGIQKIFTEAKNTVEFTPQEKGEFLIACSMNMYRGFLTVE